jgi:hypothetical protein
MFGRETLRRKFYEPVHQASALAVLALVIAVIGLMIVARHAH